MHPDIPKDVVENAQRLRSDAQLLYDAGRYASCALIQLFCLEELGKAFLVKVGRTPTKHYHREKQAAGFCLAAGKAVIRAFNAKLGDWQKELEDTYDDERLEHVFAQLGDRELMVALWGPLELSHDAKRGYFEKMRQLAAYLDLETDEEDESSPAPDYNTFDNKFTAMMFEFLDNALACVEDGYALGFATIVANHHWPGVIPPA